MLARMCPLFLLLLLPCVVRADDKTEAEAAYACAECSLAKADAAIGAYQTALTDEAGLAKDVKDLLDLTTNITMADKAKVQGYIDSAASYRSSAIFFANPAFDAFGDEVDPKEPSAIYYYTWASIRYIAGQYTTSTGLSGSAVMYGDQATLCANAGAYYLGQATTALENAATILGGY